MKINKKSFLKSFKGSQVSGDWILALILIFAACIRVYAAYTLSLSNDELSALTRARVHSIAELFPKGIYTDFHPAGVEIFIYYWIRIFGENAFVFRLPFVLTAIGSVYLIYLLGKKWFSEQTGLLAAAVFSFSSFSIIYSMFARLYSPGLFFSLLATIFWTQLVFERKEVNGKGKNLISWIGLIFSMSLCTHIHYFSFVYVAGLGLLGLFYVNKLNRVKYILSGILVILLFLPEMNVFFRQMEKGDIGGWLSAPANTFLIDFVFHVFNKSGFLFFILSALSFIGWITLIKNKQLVKFHLISLVFILFSFGIAFAYSVLRAPVLQYSTLFFILPFVLYLVLQGIEKIIPDRYFSVLVLLVLSGGLYSTIVEAKLFSRTPFGLFKNPAMDLQEWSKQYGITKVSCVVNCINSEYMNYYFNQLDFHPNVIEYRVRTPQQFSELSKVLDTLKSEYVAFTWSNCENIFEVNKIMMNKYPVLLDKRIYFNSASYLYGKIGTGIQSTSLKEFCCDFDSVVWENSGVNKSAAFAYQGNYSAQIDSGNEYPLTKQWVGSEIAGSGFRWLSCQFEILAHDTLLQALLVFQIRHGDEISFYSASELKNFLNENEKWNKVVFSQPLPEKLSQEDEVKVYIWNRKKELFFVDNYCISIDQGDDPYKQ